MPDSSPKENLELKSGIMAGVFGATPLLVMALRTHLYDVNPGLWWLDLFDVACLSFIPGLLVALGSYAHATRGSGRWRAVLLVGGILYGLGTLVLVLSLAAFSWYALIILGQGAWTVSALIASRSTQARGRAST